MQQMDGLEGVFTEMRRLYTASTAPGKRIYGERLVMSKGVEYREWNPSRSKLAAYIANGGRKVPIGADSRVLYLGASSGTTASHVADIAHRGQVCCIEFAPRMFRDLVNNSATRPNMMPLLADATKPSEYRFALEKADIVYEDVAQKGQADILVDNMDLFGAEFGMVAVKARSEDVADVPRNVFKRAERRLEERGLTIVNTLSLEPFEDSHEMIVVRR